jgi:hypothetical protein
MQIRRLLTSLPLIATPALAAGTSEGLTSIGPATFLFAVATAILLTLLLRNSVAMVAEKAGRWMACHRVRRALREIDVIEKGILPGAYGGLVRVDFALRLASGIACLRVVTVDGEVHGDANSAQWTSSGHAGRRLFLNPVIQNEGRARAIRKIVGAVPVYPIVVIIGASSSLPELDCVTDIASLPAKLSAIRGPEQPELEEAWMELKAAILSDPETRRDFEAQIGFC